MLQHDGSHPRVAHTHPLETGNLPQQEQSYTNTDFDDVFGSAPASPVLDPESGASNGIWQAVGGNIEPSDVPRLKEKHETEGYRDGITNGKATSVQAGFDEGYGLGAVLGLRIGQILGLLEGLYGAASSSSKAEERDTWAEEGKRLSELIIQAKNDLKTESVFGFEWFGKDGIWKFEVPGEVLEGKEMVFTDVATAHPLVAKWEHIVDEEIRRWGLDLDIVEADHEHSNETGDSIMDLAAASPPRPGTQKSELSW
ncbi:uncharacterized protein BP5553_09744 [Venustampulla echinocandica]|uniref:Protein YAE1 n=1 Tax=Venustampulla echinocandica TaxID=2656787 RepID=A0A370TBW2_9HELO|nr:uncharacterized protein BP5553_09744 [Venustampulla echinocandica]RDL31535.1 hypothetical protein BP5553_09744 [Venustampulla echinocandica]